MAFKFITTEQAAKTAPMRSQTTPWKKWALIAGGVLVAWYFFGSLLGLLFSRARTPLPDTGPVLLAMQNVGALHTVAFQMKDVLHFETDKKPEGWVSNLPGAESITHWATQNKALVIAEGTVEAGIDLSRLTTKDVTRVRLPNGKTVVRVHLPAITVYPPNVRVRVENSRSGPFWRDENIIPKAQEEAGRRFLKAAEEGKIREAAQSNAIETLTKMQRAFGQETMEFTFETSNKTQGGLP
jgi:hypothetical protein